MLEKRVVFWILSFLCLATFVVVCSRSLSSRKQKIASLRSQSLHSPGKKGLCSTCFKMEPKVGVDVMQTIRQIFMLLVRY